MRLRGLAIAAGALVVVIAAPGPAFAAGPEGEISHISSQGGKVNLVFQGNGLPEGAGIDLNSISVTIDGHKTKSTAVAVTDVSVPRTAVLAFDVSASMKEQLPAAQAAAEAFINGLPPDVEVALVSFDAAARVVTPADRDHAQILRDVAKLDASGVSGTALYDGVVTAAEEAGPNGIRSILLLTDGNPTKAGVFTEAQALSKVRDAHIGLNAVYISKNPATVSQDPVLVAPRALTRLVVTGAHGRLLVSHDNLGELFRQEAQGILTQLAVQAKVPKSAGHQGSVRVTALAGGTQISGAATTVLSQPPRPVTNKPSSGDIPVDTSTPVLARYTALVPALAVVFLGLALLCYAVFSAGRRIDDAHDRIRRRLSIYTLAGRSAQPPSPDRSAFGRSHVARSAVALTGRMVQRRQLDDVVGKRLEAGAILLRAPEWMLIHIGVAIGCAVLLLLLSGGSLLATLAGLVVGLVLPWMYLGVKESRRTSAFLAQLPDTLQLLSGSLSAGYSMPQAMDMVVREGQQPMSGEFNRALVEARLGSPVESALDGIAARMSSRDFSWVVMAIRIQREVGGNLAELLTTVAATMRERERLRRQIRVLSAEGRLSAWVLGLLPLVFTLYLMVARPGYLRPLVHNSLGWLMIITGTILLIVGTLWMRKSVKVEV